MLPRPLLPCLMLALCLAGELAAESFTCIDEGGRTVSRVVGGTAIGRSEAPYQVALLIFDGEDTILCGGSLISRGHVLTAAHCVTDTRADGSLAVIPAEEIVVLYNGDSIDTMLDTGHGTLGAAVHVHPGYRDQVPFPDDIAVIRLAETLDLPQTSIMTLASAPMERALMADFTCARVTGYGKRSDGKTSDQLQVADLYIRPKQDCLEFSPRVSDRMICAGYKREPINACNGDSGGPLVIREGPTGWVQVGVVSWGNKDCTAAGSFGVFTRVSSYIDWIMEVTH